VDTRTVPDGLKPRDDAEAGAALEAELERLAPRREALGEGGVYAVAAWSLQMAYEWEAAVLAWTRAVACLPDNAPAVFQLGVCRLELGELDAASKLFERALDVDSGVAAGGAGEALDWFEEDPHLKLGNVHHLRGDLERAIACYDRSATRNRTAVEALTEIVRCHLARNDAARALAAADRLAHRSSRPSVLAEVEMFRSAARALQDSAST
jgi:tetratricopeptide (TPR) repeat protein